MKFWLIGEEEIPDGIRIIRFVMTVAIAAGLGFSILALLQEP